MAAGFNFPPALLSLPPATRALTALLISASALLFFLRLSLAPTDLKAIFGASNDATLAFPWLVLLPGSVLWYPWTLVTAGFVETNFLEFIISLLTLPPAGRYLERVWGQAEFLKFVAVVILASNVVAVVVNVLESYAIGDPGLFLYGMSYHGLMGLQVGFLVAFTQLIPEHQVQMFGGLAKIRVKSLPMLYVTLSNVACLLGYQSPYILIQFGWLGSWAYLRFVKQNEGGDFRGDRSETFAFAAWFPPFAQKYVAVLSTFVFSIFVRLRLLRPWTDIESGTGGGGGGAGGAFGGGGGGGGAGVPGGARAEAERRRAMALKALDQRMASKPAAAGSATTASTSASLANSPVVPAAATREREMSGSGAAVGAGGEGVEVGGGAGEKVKE